MMRTCRNCGCDEEVHEHYRNGTDCGVCGPEVCKNFRPKRRSIVEFLRGLAEPPTFTAVTLGTKFALPAAWMCEGCKCLVGDREGHSCR